MKNGKLSYLPWGLLAMLGSTSALAQEAESTATGTASTEVSAEARANGDVGLGLPGATPAATTTAAAVAPPPGGTDHEAVVGHMAVGYLGVASVGVGSSDAGAIVQQVEAPVIGVRYWLNPGMGLDLGLGFGLEGSSTEVDGEGGDDGPSFWALVLHGGVPLALSTGRHYVFEIIPEANLGFGSGSAGDAVDHGGFLFDIGARAGAELHFGFIGVPELSLQASVGARYSLQSHSTTTDTGGNEVEVSSSEYSLRTAVYNSPWSIFTSSVAAFYYF